MQAAQQEINQKLDRLRAFWQSRKDARDALPSRKDFDMSDLKPWLGNLIIYAVYPGQPFRLKTRLFGTKMREAAQVENTGIFLEEFTPPDLFDQVFAPYKQSCESGEPKQIERHTAFEDVFTRSHDIWATKLVLPLADDGKNIDHFLVAIYNIYPEHIDFDRRLIFV